MTYNSRTVLNVVAAQESAKRKNHTRVLESYHTALVTNTRQQDQTRVPRM